tara:strand:+ start:2720 stop:3022 length:303 start_codon:yes stop_codon:yes gene_type:complete
MLKSYIILALFLLSTGEVSKIDQSENKEVFWSQELCEQELSSLEKDDDYRRVEYPGNDQIFYERSIGEYSLRLTCLEVDAYQFIENGFQLLQEEINTEPS